ncbi:MAG TPA: hypothetical protein VHA77_14565 [Xanthobacteraceae bacterium]|jgi:hypothetical protein|nr:hypothetical protein [Xanthobacteraceae bacterium]
MKRQDLQEIIAEFAGGIAAFCRGSGLREIEVKNFSAAHDRIGDKPFDFR